MKSFVAFPEEIKSSIASATPAKTFSGKVLAHYELYKRITHLKGSIVKCGVNSEAGYLTFAELTSMIDRDVSDKVIAFEKVERSLFFDGSEEEVGFLQYKTLPNTIDADSLTVKQLRIGKRIEFIPGNVSESIPKYLLENPDLRIAFLVVDMDDYEATLTTLQIFYPRLMPGGVLVFDNFHKREEDYLAASDYFRNSTACIHEFALNKETHYMIRH